VLDCAVGFSACVQRLGYDFGVDNSAGIVRREIRLSIILVLEFAQSPR